MAAASCEAPNSEAQNSNPDPPYLEYLPLDRPIPGGVLESRRPGFSGGSMLPIAYVTTPRMMRRGAISYDKSDVTALYIRFLADAMCKRNRYIQNPITLPDMPAPNLNLLVNPPPPGRRGSLRTVTPASSYRDTMKNSTFEVFNVDMEGKIAEKLAKYNSWNFDVFAFRRVTEGRPLFHLGFHLLQEHKLITTLKLNVLQLMRFLALVEDSYHPQNCYHNCTHAADVTQALNCLISEPKLYSKLTPIELFAALLAAMCHDMDHPGVNQNYLIKTSSHLAFIHGSTSILEHHHCHEARALIKQTGIINHFSEEERKEVASLMDKMILATDLSHHAEFMTQIEELTSEPLDLSCQDTKETVLTIAIRAADISNPGRSFELSKCWSDHIMEEFFRQGDIERKQRLTISAFCDRHITVIPKVQSGFFTYVALPLFKEWSKIFDDSPLSKLVCKNIEKNLAYWDGLVAEMEAMGELPGDSNTSNSDSSSDDEQYEYDYDQSFADQPYETDAADQSFENQPCETDDADQSYNTDDAAQPLVAGFADLLSNALLTAQSYKKQNASDTDQPSESESADQHHPWDLVDAEDALANFFDIKLDEQPEDSPLVTPQPELADNALATACLPDKEKPSTSEEVPN